MNKKPTRVLVNGALGHMGSMACETLKAQQEFELVGALTKQDNLAEAIANTQAEIVVDLTRADCVYGNSRCIIQQGARPVIGTSGLLAHQIEELASLCERKQLGGIIAPNFSIGAMLMMRFAAKAAEYFPEVEIIETHHQKKLDAPSGTAMKTAELIAQARKNPKNKLELKELVAGARGGVYQDVSIHSLRLPGILARQEVLFGGLGETLSIKHHSTDRQSFMAGIVLACEKVLTLSSLVYGLEQLL